MGKSRTVKPRQKPTFKAGFLIHDVSRLRRTVFDQRLKFMHVTRSQWWVLTMLSRHDREGFTQIELARLLDVGKVTLGGLIDRLAKNGLVERVDDKADRRSNRILMTRKGRLLLNKLEVIGVGINEEIMRDITEEEEEQLISILGKMKGTLIEMDALPKSMLPSKDKDATNDVNGVSVPPARVKPTPARTKRIA